MSFHLITKYRKAAYAFFIIVAFVCSIIILGGRVKMEKAADTVEIVMDYDDLKEMCRRENVSVDAAMDRLKDAGVTSMAFTETTFEKLQDRGVLQWTSGAELLTSLSLADGTTAAHFRQIHPGALCVVDMDPTMEKILINNLKLLWGGGSYKLTGISLKNGRKMRVLQVFGKMKDVPYLGVGFDRALINSIAGRGFNVVLRPENRTHLNAGQVKRFFDNMAALPRVTTVIFGGTNEITGYPLNLEAAVEGFKKTGFSFGDVEAPNVRAKMKGAQYVGQKIPEKTVRVQSITAQYLAKLTPVDAVDKFRLGVRERNIRVVYIRPYPSGYKGRSVMDANVEYVGRLVSELKKYGFNTGVPSRLPKTNPPGYMVILITLGGVSIFLLLLQYFYVDKNGMVEISIFALVLIVTAGMVFTGKLHLAQKLSALAIGVIFPVYAFTVNFEEMEMIQTKDRLPNALGYAMYVLARITTVSILGGLFIAAIMSSTTYMLSIDRFRGVKAVLFLPPVLTLLAYYLKGTDKRNTFKGLMTGMLYIWQVVVLGIMGAVGMLYIMRSGNTAAMTPESEQGLRVLMEKVLFVRPRFKEFLIGHPALIFTFGLSYLHQYTGLGLFVVFAAMGQADILDTFAHIHTPLYVSIIRSLNGAVLGAIIGAALFSLYWLAMKQFKKGENDAGE